MANLMIVGGAMHLHAGVTGDIRLARQLMISRLLLGVLDLGSVLADRALPPAFLLFAALELASAAWVAMILRPASLSIKLKL
jgi:hypothetical protein